MIGSRRCQLARRESAEVKEIGEEADESGERERDEGAGDTNAHRHECDDKDAGIGGEIPASCVGNG